MAARIDPFVDVLLREQGDQLYLLPDEPVTMVKDGKPRKASRQPLTDQHIYALLVQVAPSVFRTRGEVRRQATPALSSEQLEMMLLSVMPERNRGEWKETGDSDFAYEIGGLARFRVNAARDRKGPIAVFRVIPAKVVSVEQLGISKEVQQLCYLTKGLVLVTGPTGSGKSTTLCALVDLINRTRTDHIITIEDPIEFVHENKKCVITQRQVGVHTDSFKRALRSALREDPDIVLVG